jgi:hypothetical protein
MYLREDGKIFANAGAWTSSRSYYLEIQQGEINLKEWRGKGRQQKPPITTA